MDGISALCVSNRPEYLAWLLWNYDKQEYHGTKELVIVGLNLPVPWRPDIKYINTSGNIPRKRNVALRAARYEVLTWFDDDDWQHPRKLQILKSKVKHDKIVGCQKSYFVSEEKVDRFVTKDILFNSVGFWRGAPLFDEAIEKGSDYYWLQKTEAERIIVPEVLFFWLCHDRNVSNPSDKLKGKSSINSLMSDIGEHWDWPLEKRRKLLGSVQ